MEITNTYVKTVLDTLPIGYYLGRKLNVELSNRHDTSCIDIFNDKLYISEQQILNVTKNYSIEYQSDLIENDIRCLLYHEVSHALLTPLNLYVTKKVNVFEDERIETICKNYYNGVDFKSFVIRVNNYNGEKPTDVDSFFYQIVRFRVGPSQFIERVNDIINNYKSLNRSSDWCTTYDYQNDIKRLYADIEDYFNSQQEETKQEETKQENVQSSNEETEQEETSLNEETEQEEDIQSLNEDTEQEETEETKQTSQSSDEETEQEENSQSSNNSEDVENEQDFSNELNNAKEELKKSFDYYVNKELRDRVYDILFKTKVIAKQNGSAINAYSGIFDPRSVIRDDYKYFVQSNRQGNVKRFSKIKLNLFIDTSGSFCYNEQITNQLLHTLKELETLNKDFSFDVVSMNTKIELLKKDNRKITCNNCNDLPAYIFKIYNSIQDKSAKNINIVLFDGDALSSYGYRMSEYKLARAENFKVFNHSNVTIISDYDNETYLKKHCTSAKVILTSDYVKHFINNVISGIQYGLK